MITGFSDLEYEVRWEKLGLTTFDAIFKIFIKIFDDIQSDTFYEIFYQILKCRSLKLTIQRS